MDIYKEGYMLCCFGSTMYFKLTQRMVLNIRRYDPNRYICILTDNVLFFNEEYKKLHKLIVLHFNYMDHPLDEVDMTVDWNKFGLIPKIFHPYYTPFRYTMFLDVDMVFHTDFTFFWNNYYSNKQNTLYTGISDKDNKSPAWWHWNTINEVMESSKINIPAMFGVLIIYDTNLKKYIDKYLSTILKNIGAWRIKPWFRNGIVDEIIYAIIFGIECIKPDEEIYNWILNTKTCDAFNKNV